MKPQVILFSSLFFISLYAETTQKPSFVIQPKKIKESTNTLKEHVGTSVQKTLKEVVKLQKQTAMLQQKLAETEHYLLKAGSSILKNKDPFKKASKEELASAESTINLLQNSIDEGIRMVNIITQQTEKHTLKSTSCFKLTKTKPA